MDTACRTHFCLLFSPTLPYLCIAILAKEATEHPGFEVGGHRGAAHSQVLLIDPLFVLTESLPPDTTTVGQGVYQICFIPEPS